MPNHCYYLAISFTNHLYLYSYIYSLAMHLRYSSAPLVIIIVRVFDYIAFCWKRDSFSFKSIKILIFPKK